MKTLFKALALCCFALAAGTAHAADRTPALILLGGYNSCHPFATSPTRTNVAAGAEALKSQIAAAYGLEEALIPWFDSCYVMSRSDTPDLLVESSNSVGGDTYADKLTNFVATLHGTPDLIVIGHSWGAMLAIDTLADLKTRLAALAESSGRAELANARILFVSLDAIDYNYCRPPILGHVGAVDCQRAPRTLAETPGKLEALMGSVQGWLNVYQESGHLLHSGPITSLTNQDVLFGNLMFDYPDDALAHVSLVNDVRTWTAIAARLDAFFAL